MKGQDFLLPLVLFQRHSSFSLRSGRGTVRSHSGPCLSAALDTEREDGFPFVRTVIYKQEAVWQTNTLSSPECFGLTTTFMATACAEKPNVLSPLHGDASEHSATTAFCVQQLGFLNLTPFTRQKGERLQLVRRENLGYLQLNAAREGVTLLSSSVTPRCGQTPRLSSAGKLRWSARR